MADDTIRNENAAVRDDVDARNDTEPATKHDVTEGGVIGAVGGAIVGGIAGGPLAPLGAVIGAVVGGVASAGAVDVVDKHDHDYNRTVAGTGTDDYSDYDADYRAHHQANYAGTGATYDEYGPAYRYGHGLATDARYQNQDWDTVEPTVRNDWEGNQPGTWDRFKGSVRHAYDRKKSHV